MKEVRGKDVAPFFVRRFVFLCCRRRANDAVECSGVEQGIAVDGLLQRFETVASGAKALEVRPTVVGAQGVLFDVIALKRGA